MKRILMRGGMTPLDNFHPESIIQNNYTGANSGNLLYAYSVYRTLMTEDTIIDMDYYGVERNYTDEDILQINEKYDAYVCPLADAFRDAFENKLLKYADFFNKLTIPCFIIGLGLRAPYEPDIGAPRKFDHAAKQFLKAVLRKSSMVGLRGEITGEYLKYLGFKEGQDYTVIGCPSMYALGTHLSQRDISLSETSKIAFNLSSITPENIVRFAFNEMQTFKNHYLVEQNIDETKLLYYGKQYQPNKSASVLLPRKISHPLLQENRYRIFVNIPTWLEFLRDMNLSIGSKLHGNVAALLAGCPALFMPIDSRMRELVAYHKFPAIPYMEIQESDTIANLIEKIDMKSHLKCQRKNFEHFVEFLNCNRLDHIYKNDHERTDAPLDEKMKAIDYYCIESILECSNQEVVRRIGQLNESQMKTIKNLKNKLSKQSAILERPGVKFALGLLDKYPVLEKWIKKGD